MFRELFTNGLDLYESVLQTVWICFECFVYKRFCVVECVHKWFVFCSSVLTNCFVFPSVFTNGFDFVRVFVTNAFDFVRVFSTNAFDFFQVLFTNGFVFFECFCKRF